MTIQTLQGSAHLRRLMAVLPVLCEDREERGGGLVEKDNMDNLVYPHRGTQATIGQQGGFLNRCYNPLNPPYLRGKNGNIYEYLDAPIESEHDGNMDYKIEQTVFEQN